MPKVAFGGLPLIERERKPRQRGITVLVDFGIGLREQQDLCETCAEYVDFAKLVLAVSSVLPSEVVRDKIRLWRQFGIEAFPGGQLFEIAYVMGRVADYFDACAQVGYRYIEISDNHIDIEPEEKAALTKIAREKYGFIVFGESGKKAEEERTPAAVMVADVLNMTAAGAWKVFVEASELLGGWSVIEGLTSQIPVDRLVFETPGTWMKGVDNALRHEIWFRLLQQFGPDVNIGNVEPKECLDLEMLRLGVGLDADRLRHGTFYLAKRGLTRPETSGS